MRLQTKKRAFFLEQRASHLNTKKRYAPRNTIKCIVLLTILLSLCLKFKLLQIIDLYSTLLVLHRRYVCYLMNHDGNSHKNVIAVDLEKPDTIKQI